MTRYGRPVRGAEAGALAAAALELAFFVLDLVRLQPLATPGVLSGALLGPGGVALDLTSWASVIGVLWAAYQIVMLSFAHFVAFAVAGVLASLFFDWSRPWNVGRLVVVAALCVVAFYATAALSSSALALESIGTVEVLVMNLLAAVVLGGALRFAAAHDAKESPAG